MALNNSQYSAQGMLPPELWVDVLSFLSHADLGRALCTCRALSDVSQDAWRAACYRRWPTWAAIAEQSDAQWRRVYELLDLRDSEIGVVTDVEALRKRQSVINERHRAILTEWLCEVSFDWNLDSSLVFEAVKYLDCYLTRASVEKLGSFQLVGLACLRKVIADFPRPSLDGLLPEQLLDSDRFSHISDNTYTSEQVEEATKLANLLIPPHLKDFPNPKMHLRSFWFRATVTDIVGPQEDIHIYTLASFLLQLSVLDLECSAYAPSKLAAAALSLALTAFGKPAWPQSLQTYGSYILADLEPLRHRLATVQADQTAGQLRGWWKRTYAAEEGEEHTAEWERAIALFQCPCRDLLRLLGQQKESHGAGAAAVARNQRTEPGEQRGELLSVQKQEEEAEQDKADASDNEAVVMVADVHEHMARMPTFVGVAAAAPATVMVG